MPTECGNVKKLLDSNIAVSELKHKQIAKAFAANTGW